MNNLINEFKYALTVDNSHEEDNDVFEEYTESTSNYIMYVLSVVGIMSLLILQCMR